MEKKITITKKELAGLFFDATDKVATEMFKDDVVKQFMVIAFGAKINKELDKLLFEESEPEKEEPKEPQKSKKKIKDLTEEETESICFSIPMCGCDKCPLNIKGTMYCKHQDLATYGEEEIDVSPYLKDGD